MIYVDGNLISNKRFPDHTLSLQLEFKCKHIVHISWYYDNDEEMMIIYYITKHLQSQGLDVRLTMPYIPNARMDRVDPVKKPGDIFTLKYFAEFINSLNFTEVRVLDPHSNVATALINHIVCLDIFPLIHETLTSIVYDVAHDVMHEDRMAVYDNLITCYPDEGAMKRYSKELDFPYCFGIKKRNSKNDIEKFDLINGEIVNGKHVLIMDDICSKGGTSLRTANALREAGAKNIYLYITHCEDNIFNGTLLDGDLIKKVFTTNSIYRGNHPKIEVLTSKY
jgi:ribose-phosphate pyrophosphokinase